MRVGFGLKRVEGCIHGTYKWENADSQVAYAWRSGRSRLTHRHLVLDALLDLILSYIVKHAQVGDSQADLNPIAILVKVLVE